MGDLTKHLKDELLSNGADLVGIGDLSEVPAESRYNTPFGVAVAVKYEPEIIKGISEMPTREYYDAYNRLNNKLDMLVTLGADFLITSGYNAIAQTIKEVEKNETDYNTVFPHKTVATRAGLGWIGKSALLVTKEYGSAVRLSAILTNASLIPDKPVNNSYCGDCMLCTKACPADAVLGKNWSVETKREEIYDAYKCREVARERAFKSFGILKTICGKCIYVCPYTQRYINSY